MKRLHLGTCFYAVGTCGALLGLCACGTPRPAGDAAYLTAMERGGTAYVSRYMDTASGEYEKAFQRALAMNETLPASDAAYNLAMVYAQQRDYPLALAMIQTAMDCMRIGGREPSWDCWILSAKIQAGAGSMDAGALDAARQAASAPGGQEANAVEQTDLLIAQLQWKLGQVEEASGAVSVLMKKKLSARTQAGCLMLRGDMGSSRGLYKDAAGDYRSAANLLKTAGDYFAMADAMMREADALAAGSTPAEALPVYLDAAWTLYGQQRNVEALQAVERAMSRSGAEADAAQAERAKRLVDIIQRQMPAAKEEQQ